MSIVSQLLTGIEDAAKLAEHMQSGPLVNLIGDYNELAKANPGLPSIGTLSTGADLKGALEQLAAKDLVALMHKYTTALEDAPIDKAEVKSLKALATKVTIFALAPVPCLIVGATVVLGVKNGALASNPVFDSLLNTATEILKLIFSASGS